MAGEVSAFTLPLPRSSSEPRGSPGGAPGEPRSGSTPRQLSWRCPPSSREGSGPLLVMGTEPLSSRELSASPPPPGVCRGHCGARQGSCQRHGDFSPLTESRLHYDACVSHSRGPLCEALAPVHGALGNPSSSSGESRWVCLREGGGAGVHGKVNLHRAFPGQAPPLLRRGASVLPSSPSWGPPSFLTPSPEGPEAPEPWARWSGPPGLVGRWDRVASHSPHLLPLFPYKIPRGPDSSPTLASFILGVNSLACK